MAVGSTVGLDTANIQLDLERGWCFQPRYVVLFWVDVLGFVFIAVH